MIGELHAVLLVEGEHALELRRPAWTRGAAAQRPDAGQELGERERLQQIVVRAEVERLHARLDGVTCGQHEHRHMWMLHPKVAQDVHAVAIRQPEIEHYEVDVSAGSARERCDAIADGRDIDALLMQALRQGLHQAFVVFDQQDPHRSSATGDYNPPGQVCVGLQIIKTS